MDEIVNQNASKFALFVEKEKQVIFFPVFFLSLLLGHFIQYEALISEE